MGGDVFADAWFHREDMLSGSAAESWVADTANFPERSPHSVSWTTTIEGFDALTFEAIVMYVRVRPTTLFVCLFMLITVNNIDGVLCSFQFPLEVALYVWSHRSVWTWCLSVSFPASVASYLLYADVCNATNALRRSTTKAHGS